MRTDYRRIDRMCLAAALLYFALIFLFGTFYRGWQTARLSFEAGRFVPIVAAEPYAPFGGDYFSEWLAGRTVLEGNAALLYDREYILKRQHDESRTGIHFPDGAYIYLFYPPWYYVLVAPTAGLPVQLASLLWLALMTSCLLVALRLLSGELGVPLWFGGIMVLAVVFTPLQESIESGQKGSLWLLLFVGAFVLLRQRSPFRAGLVFGLLACKPPLLGAVLLAMLLKRQGRFLAGAAVTGAALVLLALAVSPAACRDYLDTLLFASDFSFIPQYPVESEHCLYGFCVLVLRPLAMPLVAKLAAGALALGVVLALPGLLTGRLEFASDRFALQFAALVLATALVSPKFLNYDMTLLLLPMVVMAWVGIRSPVPHLRWGLGAAVVAVYLAGSFSKPLGPRLGFQLSVPILLGAFLLVRSAARWAPALAQVPAAKVPEALGGHQPLA